MLRLPKKSQSHLCRWRSLTIMIIVTRGPERSGDSSHFLWDVWTVGIPSWCLISWHLLCMYTTGEGT